MTTHTTTPKDPTVSSQPIAPDLDKLGNDFRAAVAKGKDGRAEYTAWLSAWHTYEADMDAARQAAQKAHDAAKRQFDHLWQEARRLNALEHRIGTWVDSADRGTVRYTHEIHQRAEAKWRTDLAAYQGKPVAADTPVNVNELPLPPHLNTPYFDRTAGPRTFSEETDAALNAAIQA
jgi:hypothetical protein